MTHTDFSKIDIKDIAAIISKKLSDHGIEAVLVGGAVVSVYSCNRYISYDLDYVIYDDLKKVKIALSELGFFQKGKYFVHQNCPFFIDFVSPPVAIGAEPVKKFEQVSNSFGKITLLTATDCVKDRLASFFHWDDAHALEQAIWVCEKQKVKLSEIEVWSQKEGFIEKFRAFKQKLARARALSRDR